MIRCLRRFNACGIAVLAVCSILNARDLIKKSAFAPGAVPSEQATLWHEQNTRILNLAEGPGGKENRPSGKLTFVKEDRTGTSPKFEVVDERGVHWKAKLGEESRAETAATRLVWAAGYFADADYYFPKLRIENMPHLHRGREFMAQDGSVAGVRLERRLKSDEKGEHWSWYDNPFTGSREFNGLRTLMALINNWDLKEDNNAKYPQAGAQLRYGISDLGATFGRTGDVFVRSKSDLRNYRQSKFIQKVTPEYVDFYMSSRPFILSVFDVPNYIRRTRMQSVAKHIPRAHAKWLGQVLAQLTDEQIRECFRAADYSPEEVSGFASVVEQRIAELTRL